VTYLDIDLSNTPAFLEQGLCAQTDPEAFFPEQGASASPAKAVCRRCDFRAECLDWALDHHEKGVWGGTTDHERRQLKRDRRTAA